MSATTRTTVDDRPAAPPDEAASRQALGRTLDILDAGGTCLLAGLGQELGLFDTLAELGTATSVQLADAAGLDERYVREWLGGVAAAGFVQHEPRAGTWTLAPAHAPFVTGSGTDNLTRLMRYVALMGEAYPRIAACFREGGGLSYEDYRGFHALMAEESAATHDAALLDVIVPLTGETARLAAGIDVADIACGSGHALNLLGEAYPRSTFVGYDFSPEAVAAARAEAARRGLPNVRFELLDVARLHRPGAFDLVLTFDAIHDQADPAAVLANIRRSLRPGGTYLMVDINMQSAVEDNLAVPWASFVYALSTFHCMAVSLGQGGAGLGTAWGVQTAERMLREAGFGEVRRIDLEQDPFNAYFVART